jgi:hypothetical protein
MIIFDSIGGGIVGWPLLAVGFWKLSSVNKSFRTASALSVLCMVYSVINLLVLLKVVSDVGLFYKVSYSAYLAVCATLHFSFMLSIRQVAKEGKSQKLADGAASRLYLTEVYYFWALIVIFFPALASGVLGQLLLAFRFIIGVIILSFIYTCYAQITTASQLEKDKIFFKELEEKKAAVLKKKKK